jgi:hypothetical protein
MHDENETRQCPYCREDIRADAVRCKHCRSAVPRETPTHGGACPYCREEIHPEAIKCKHCGSVVGQTWGGVAGEGWVHDMESWLSEPRIAELMQAIASSPELTPGASGVGAWDAGPDVDPGWNPGLDPGGGPVNLAAGKSCGPCDRIGDIEVRGRLVWYRKFRRCSACTWVYDGPLGFPRLECNEWSEPCGRGTAVIIPR